MIMFRKARLALFGLMSLGLAFAVFLPAPPTHAATPKHPNLTMATPTDLQIDTQTISGHRLLRFTARILNSGSGPFELTGTKTAGETTTMSTVTQRIYDDAGGSAVVSTPATMIWSGDGHNHWHVKNLAQYRLSPVSDNDSVKTAAKVGFCFYDNYQYNLSSPGAPQSPKYTNCGSSPSATSVTMGLSVGWGDTYGANLAYQWIDLYDPSTGTNWPNGYYNLRLTADPSGWFSEQNETDNATCIKIRIGKNSSLKGNSVTNVGPCS
jgi:Lysyl oxidase